MFSEEATGLGFHPAPPPSDDEVARLLATIRSGVRRLLRRRGLEGDEDLPPPDPLAEESVALARISAASVTKNDLAAGMLPSGKFGANAAWYRLTLLTYNVLTVLRRRALPERFHQARPKRLRYEVFTVPAEIHTHARQLTARLGAPPLTVDELIAARRRLRELQAAVRAAGAPSHR